MKDRWYKIDDKVRFLLVGGFNFSVSYLIYSAACIVLGTVFYQISLVLAWIFSSVISFTTQKFLVFRSSGFWFREYLKCCTTWFFSYLINAIVLEILVKLGQVNVYIAQLIATAVCAIFTYILFKKFAFKNHS